MRIKHKQKSEPSLSILWLVRFFIIGLIADGMGDENGWLDCIISLSPIIYIMLTEKIGGITITADRISDNVR